MENHDIDQIILAFLQKEATANEIEILRKWLSEEAANQEIFNSVKLYWENSTLRISTNDTHKAYDKLMSNSNLKSTDKIVDINSAANRTRSKQKSIYIPWFKIAATLFLFITIVGSAYFILNTNKISPDIIVTRSIIKQNPKGQKLTTYLPDGSKVILNSFSEIRYESPFIGNERKIELIGEAFFEVKKDSAKPFKVLSNGITTTALGTSFNVNSKIENHVEVSLVTGKVRVVDNAFNEVVLNPGNAAISTKNGVLEIKKFNYLDKVGWKDGVLVFNENSLATIFRKLEDWYGVKFEVDKNNLGQYHYTGNYKNESLDEVLEGISFVHRFEYKISGDTVEIIFNKKTKKPM